MLFWGVFLLDGVLIWFDWVVSIFFLIFVCSNVFFVCSCFRCCCFFLRVVRWLCCVVFCVGLEVVVFEVLGGLIDVVFGVG